MHNCKYEHEFQTKAHLVEGQVDTPAGRPALHWK